MAKIADAASNPAGYVRSQSQGGDRAPPHLIRKRRFVPVEHEGEMEDAPPAAKLTVDLGGEAMRCLVRLVVDEDTVVVEVTGIAMSKNHAFRRGDFAAAKRGRHMGGHDEWTATSRNAIDEAQYAALAEQRRQRLEAQEQVQAKKTGRRRGAPASAQGT